MYVVVVVEVDVGAGRGREGSPGTEKGRKKKTFAANFSLSLLIQPHNASPKRDISDKYYYLNTIFNVYDWLRLGN